MGGASVGALVNERGCGVIVTALVGEAEAYLSAEYIRNDARNPNI
jgi:hypothetical protein